jgi:hypothetical protein
MLSNCSIEFSIPLLPGVTLESPDFCPSRAEFDASISNWINKVKWTKQMPGLKREREYDRLYLKR